MTLTAVDKTFRPEQFNLVSAVQPHTQDNTTISQETAAPQNTQAQVQAQTQEASPQNKKGVYLRIWKDGQNEQGTSFCRGAPWAYEFVSVKEAIETAALIYSAFPSSNMRFTVIGDMSGQLNSHLVYPDIVDVTFGQDYFSSVYGARAVLSARKLHEYEDMLTRRRKFLKSYDNAYKRVIPPAIIHVKLADFEREALEELYLPAIKAQCSAVGIQYDQALVDTEIRDANIKRLAAVLLKRDTIAPEDHSFINHSRRKAFTSGK